MRIFDKMAETSRNKGLTSKDFHIAAEKQAGATLIYAIIGGMVLYFFDWRWSFILFAMAIFSVIKSFSATIIEDKLMTMSISAIDNINPLNIEDAVYIINAYGAVLETNIEKMTWN